MSSSNENFSSKEKVPVPGSERTPLFGARATGETDPNERIDVTVVVRPTPSSKTSSRIEDLSSSSPNKRKYLSRDEFEAVRGASKEDLERVQNFARQNDLKVTEVSASKRSVKLSGTVSSFNRALGVKLQRYTHPQGTYRGREGRITIPKEIAGVVQSIHGLDNRPQARPHIQPSGKLQPRGTGNSYTPIDLARLYNFPKTDGSGQCIGIIELGGGYRTEDLNSCFTSLQIKAPTVTSVSVDGGQNTPGVDQNADGEVELDIQVAGAIANAANIVVYFAPNTDQGFLNAITTAIHDNAHNPSVISISWGASESQWTSQSMQTFNQAFQDGAALGVTVCCAAGDHGSSDGDSDGLNHVDFPASSIYALACGGTRLESSKGSITNELVWNNNDGWATGGGVSEFFDRPEWQRNANVPASLNSGHHVGRGVPDLAADADGQTGYIIIINGQQHVFGGTSAVAPLIAALVALINQSIGNPSGFITGWIYTALSSSPGAFHDIISGTNGAFSARPGWDACTGWGRPDGIQFLNALKASIPS